jgi:hypothetical protein
MTRGSVFCLRQREKKRTDSVSSPSQHRNPIAAICSNAYPSRINQKPTNTAASSTDLRSDTTALAGNVSSGQPSAMLFMMI